MYRPLHARPSTPTARRATTITVLIAATFGSSLAVSEQASAHTTARSAVSAVAPATSVAGAAMGNKIVAEAASHIGKPYVYGAAGPSRFDCSGYTKYVFAQFSKSLPHSSAAQLRSTVRVAKSAKQPGDLIFMRSRSGRVTHVGIYAGANRWLVAPKSGDRVKLQTLYSSRYTVGRVR